MPLAAALPALIGAGTAIYSANQTKKAQNKAIQSQQEIANNLKYTPIDLEALKKSATEQAIANATQSMALERQLTPDIASARETYARQVRQDLERGGQLDPDTANRVTQAGNVIGATSGVGSSSTIPLTAALLGLSSMQLANQRKDRAANLIGSTELPVAGLDPGSLATLEVQQNAAQNQFNLEKAGVDSSLAEQTAVARGTQIAGQVGTVQALGGLVGNPEIKKLASGIAGGLFSAFQPALSGRNTNQNPMINPMMATGTSLLG